MPITQEQIDETLANNGLNYNVQTYQEHNPFDGGGLPFYGTYRDDNNHVFRTGLSKSYKTIQNQDAFRTLVDLSKVEDVSLVSAGSWRDGAEVWAQINFNGGIDVGGKGDIVDQRVTFYSRHDGQSSLSFLITPIRIWCHNQLASMFSDARAANRKGLSKLLKVSHTAAGVDRLEILSQQANIINGVFKETAQVYNRLADQKVSKEIVNDVLENLYPSKDVSPRSLKANEEARATIINLFADADGGRVAWNTAWNLYNAVTNYTNHHQKGFSDKERSLLVGTGAESLETSLETINRICLS